MAETVALTCLTVVKEAVDEVIARGVPEAAATDFILGHLNVSIAILFGLIDAEVSDGARLAVERAKTTIFQPDWKRVFEDDDVMSQVKDITVVQGAPQRHETGPWIVRLPLGRGCAGACPDAPARRPWT